MNRLAQLRVLFFPAVAVVFDLAAGTAIFAAEKNAKEFTEDEKINGRVEGYYVRVKSRISGEKQIYYNPDGSMKSADGDGLLGGDFSLDESLLSPDGEGSGGAFDFNFLPPPSEKKTPAQPVPAQPASTAGKKSSRPPSVSGKPVPAPSAPEPAGTVDEHAALKKFARKKEQGDFGVRENWKNVLDMETNERFSEKFSIREWMGSSVYGLRRYGGEIDTQEMRRAETRGNAFPMSRVESSSQTAGDRLFVRTEDGSAVEFRFNKKFSPGEHFSASERVRELRETSGFSMQDINRYQFRRNRSSEAGLPVASPESGENVRRENFGRKTTP